MSSEEAPFSPSKAERLILIMLAELLEKAGESELNPTFIKDALYRGHDWAIDWELPGIMASEPKPREAVTEVADILDMWLILEETYEALGQDDKDAVGRPVRFPGFDGNRESAHASIARFMVKIPGRFDSYKGRSVDGGVMRLGAYRRMLEVFLPMRPIRGERHFNVGELKQILAAETHPDYR